MRDLNVEVDCQGRSWVIEGQVEDEDVPDGKNSEDIDRSLVGIQSRLDKLVTDFHDEEYGEHRVCIEMTDPVQKSWQFYVPDEDWPQLSEQLDILEENGWMA